MSGVWKLKGAKHKPTGVLMEISNYIDLPPADLKRYVEYPREVPHILLREKIAKNPKLRKRGIWQYDKDDKSTVYFTCPWCGSIGMTNDRRLGVPNGRESIFCSSSSEKCGRHLTLYYVERVDVEVIEVKLK